MRQKLTRRASGFFPTTHITPPHSPTSATVANAPSTISDDELAEHLALSWERTLDPWTPEALSFNPTLIEKMERIALAYPPNSTVGSIVENFSFVRMVSDLRQITAKLPHYEICNISSFFHEIDKFLAAINIAEFIEEQTECDAETYFNSNPPQDHAEASKTRSPEDVHLAHVNLPNKQKKAINQSVIEYFKAAKLFEDQPQDKATFADQLKAFKAALPVLTAINELKIAFTGALGKQGIMYQNQWLFITNGEVAKALGIHP